MIPEPPFPDLVGVAACAITEVLAIQFKLSTIASKVADTPNAVQSEHYLVGSVKLTGGRLFGDVHLQLP